MLGKIRSGLTVFFVLLILGAPVHAALNAVGPVNPANGFPVYYQDAVGQAMELCLSGAVGPNGPMCVLLADPGFNPGLPVIFPDNFPEESFWTIADAIINDSNGARIGVYRAALEAAFANGPVVAGDQISFARIRIRLDVPSPGGTYTVTHPYGVEVFNNVAPGVGAINFTSDVGIGTPGVFTGALNGAIGPFLTRVGGPLAVGAEQFVGDPNILEPVTGSPFLTNFVRVEGPNIGGVGIDVVQVDVFSLAGKIFAGALPSPLMLDRATYSRAAGAGNIDVFAYSSPTATLQATYGGANYPMVQDGTTGKFYAQIPFTGITGPLGTILVTAQNPPNTATIISGSVVDVVTITQADFDSAGGLTVAATSSDDLAVITTVGFNSTDVTGGLPVLVPNVFVPPDFLTVASSSGGQDKEPTKVISFAAAGVHTPAFSSTPPTAPVLPGGTFTYNVSATDPDPLDTLIFSIDNPLPGMTILSTGNRTATFSWTPTLADVGSHSVTLRVTDSAGLSAIQTFTISVQSLEQLAITLAEFRVGGNEWRINGTTTVTVGNSITIHIGDASGPLLASSVPVDALGNWTFRQKNAATTPGTATTITAVSALGTVRTGPLTVR